MARFLESPSRIYEEKKEGRYGSFGELPHCLEIILRLIMLTFGDMIKNMGETVRDDAPLLRDFSIPGHGIGFAGPCLAISKNSAIIAFKHVFDNRSRNFVINSDLVGLLVEDFIESKGFGWFLKGENQ